MCDDGSCNRKDNIECCGCPSGTCKTSCLGRNYSTPAGCDDEETNHGSLWVWNATGGRSGKIPAYAGAGCGECVFCNGNMNDGDCKKWAKDNGKTGTWTGQCNAGTTDDSLVCVKTAWDTRNKLQCCLGQLDDTESCDPTWGKGNMLNTSCSDVMQEFCSIPEYVGTDECQQWCDKNIGVCDAPMQKYCLLPQGKADARCACINSPIPRPSCFDVLCTTSGYQTSTTPDMIDDAKNCGEFCGEIISCIDEGANGNCSQNVNQGNVTSNCGTPPTPTPSPSPSPSWLSANKFMIIFSFILLILFGIYLFKKFYK